MKILTKEELYKPENYLKPGIKLKLNMRDKKAEKFTHRGKDYVTLLYWEDYVAEDDIELVFKEGTGCYLRNIESIEILED